MPIQTLNPSLGLPGTAEQAIRLYERALGATVETMLRYREMPPSMKLPAEHADKVMHATLRIGGGVVMLADLPPHIPAVTVGENVQIVLQFDDAEELSRRFDALAQGGTVTMPPQETFWSQRYGMLT